MYHIPAGFTINAETKDFLFVSSHGDYFTHGDVQLLYEFSKRQSNWKIFSVLTGEAILQKLDV